MAEIEFTDDDVQSLSRKLSGLDLEGTEKALFNAVLALADNSLRRVDFQADPATSNVLEFDDDVDAQPDPGEAFGATMAAPPSSVSPSLRAVRGGVIY